MSLFLSLFIFYLKQMLKSFLYVGTMVFMIVMLIARFFIHLNEQFDYMWYGVFVGEMTLIVQGVMLLFMVFFYKLFSDEFKFGVNNLFVGSFKITLIKIASLLCNHLLFLVLFIGTQIGLIFIYFYFSGIPISPFYALTISFIVVYWFLPFVLAFFLGIITALIFGKKKVSLVVMIIVWLVIGPINQELFADYFESVSFSDVGSLFYIGTSSISTMYSGLVGYEVSLSKYMKIIFWILVAISILFIVLLKTTRTGREKATLIITSIVILAGNIFTFPEIFEGGKLVFDNATYKNEMNYYKEQQLEIPTNQLQYSIEEYNIKLEAINNVNAETTVSLTNINSKSLAFAMYRFFDVTKVVNQEGKRLPYSQQGDFVIVERETGETSDEITFFYTLNDSAILPVNNDYLYLPNYFSWIPKKANHPPFDTFKFQGIADELIVSSFQTEKSIKYQLSFNGNLPIYTNLSSNGDGMYEGEVSGGISVVGGMLTKEQFGDRKVIYPNSWSDISEDWVVYEKALIEVHKEVIEMFQLEEIKLPEEIVLVAPHNSKFNAFISSDHLLIQHNTLMNISSATDDIPKLYLPALLWNYDNRSFSKYEQIDAFNRIAAWYIQSQLGLGYQSSYGPLWQQFVPESFYGKFIELPDDQQEEFLVLWYEEMHNVADKWSKTINLLEGFKGEME
ncbi:ABC transporter permease [Radiobacillus sp. PE A8.2]|uniref:ABC transporter permease n=1 Tax=Radiobacillus sp. PE A8.2 TaxID=3380349 RepID=UPI00388EF3D6